MNDKRRTALEITKLIFESLEKESTQTISTLCSELSLVWRQADSYIELIKFIQEQPKLVDRKLGPKTRILSLDKTD